MVNSGSTLESVAHMFDGEMYNPEPDVHFIWPVDKVVIDWEEIEEDEPLDPYESPALLPVFSDEPYLHGAWMKGLDDRRKHQIGQGWGSWSVALSTIFHMTGGRKWQAQRPHRAPTVPDLFELSFTPEDGGWQGGVL